MVTATFSSVNFASTQYDVLDHNLGQEITPTSNNTVNNNNVNNPSSPGLSLLADVCIGQSLLENIDFPNAFDFLTGPSASRASSPQLFNADLRIANAGLSTQVSGITIDESLTAVEQNDFEHLESEHLPQEAMRDVTAKKPIIQPKQMRSLCEKGQWKKLENLIRRDPQLILQKIKMDNKLDTTLLHMAIVAKKNQAARYHFIEAVLDLEPRAAEIANGYGSLPLHQLLQRNVNLKSEYREALAHKLIDAFAEATLVTNTSGRTPVHIAFSDYISAKLIDHILETGHHSTAKSDKEGRLPIHVACSRHCSVEKLDMLVQANPGSLFAKTHSGETPLSLAISTATDKHPNTQLKDAIQKWMSRLESMPSQVSQEDATEV